LGQKRRTNPSFLSKDEAERDKARTEQVVKGIANGIDNSMIIPNVSRGPNIPSTPRRVLTEESKTLEIHTITNQNRDRLYDLSEYSNKKAKGPKYFPKRYFQKLKPKQLDMNSKPSIKLLGETKNFVVQLDNGKRLIEIYAKDFFIGKLFKLRINAAESKEITNLLAQARNKIEQKQKYRVGETSYFFVDVDGIQGLAFVSEKINQDIKLGFCEGEITPILDLLAKARSLF
jgi:hypothetical protein